MRSREDIESQVELEQRTDSDSRPYQSPAERDQLLYAQLSLEVLLDIRDLLQAARAPKRARSQKKP